MVFQLCFVCCQTWKVGWHQRCPQVQSLEENRFRMLPSVKAPLQTSMGQLVWVVAKSCRGRLGGVGGPDHLWCCQEGFLPGKHPVGSHCQAQAGAAEVAAQRSFCCLKVSLFWGVLFCSVASQRFYSQSILYLREVHAPMWRALMCAEGLPPTSGMLYEHQLHPTITDTNITGNWSLSFDI